MRFLTFLLSFPLLATTVTFTINGTPTVYTLRDNPRVWLDGSMGAFTAAMSDTGGRANVSNPPYVQIKALCDALTAKGTTNPYADYTANFDPFTQVANCAIRWQADGDATSLATAIYWLNHIEYLIGGSMGCDLTQSYCGLRFNDSDYTRMYLVHVAQAFSIVRSQMSGPEITAFANKILNDNDTMHNGIDTVACSNQGITNGTGTLSTTGSSQSITLALGNTSQLAVGSVIFNTSNSQIGVVGAIADSTHFSLSTPAVNLSTVSFHFSAPWTTGNCGIVWFVKHHSGSPPLIPAQEASYTTDYPPAGGTFIGPPGNLTFTADVGYIAIGLALADDDTRAVTLLEEAYNYYIDQQYTYAISSWTGFNQSGPSYGLGRVSWFASNIAIMIQNSLVSGPDLTGGNYIKKQLPFFYYGAIPTDPTLGWSFQDSVESLSGAFAIRALWPLLYLYSTSDEAKYANYYARTLRSDFGGTPSHYSSYIPWKYIFTDPAQGSTALSGAPTQYVFKDTDYSYCVGIGLTCTANIAYTMAISRTGWATTDTMLAMQSPFNNSTDHSGNGTWGSAHIFRNVWLSAGDAAGGTGGVTGNNGNREQENMIEVGGQDGMGTANYWMTLGLPALANITRWGGTNPTGDSSSRYSYAMLELTGTYLSGANVTRAQRHIAHLKKAANQDYIFECDSISLSSPTTIKSFQHYYLNGIAQGTAISYDGAARTISNTQASSKLLTKIICVDGTNTCALTRDASDGTYPGTQGYTYRIQACASSDGSTCDNESTGNWVFVHKPTTNTADTMPTITQLTSTNFNTVQVADSGSPKVVSFPVDGSTYLDATFTSTFSGTGQYLISGLTAGTYAVTIGGSPASGSPFTVSSNDNTLYFEGASGVIDIAGAEPPAMPGSTSFGKKRQFGNGVAF